MYISCSFCEQMYALLHVNILHTNQGVKQIDSDISFNTQSLY